MTVLKPKIFAVIACAVLLFCCFSCSEEANGGSNEAYHFLERKNWGLIKDKSYKLLFDEKSWQTLQNRQRKRFCMQQDNQSAYMYLKIMPGIANNLQSNYVVDVVLSYKTDKNSEEITETLEMEVLKSEDMTVWLWNDEQKTGVIMPL